MKKLMLLILMLGAGAFVGVSLAADPDVLFRESVRSYMASNGVNRAGVTNVLFGSVLPPCNGGSVTNVSAANLAGNVNLQRLTNAFSAVLVSGTFTNVVFDAGATTANWVFVNGVLSVGR